MLNKKMKLWFTLLMLIILIQTIFFYNIFLSICLGIIACTLFIMIVIFEYRTLKKKRLITFQNKSKYLRSLFFYILFEIALIGFIITISENIHNPSNTSYTITFILISIYLPSGVLNAYVFKGREKILKEYKLL